MHIYNYEPLSGSSYVNLSEKLANKKTTISVKNEKDNECFKWAKPITSAVYPRAKDPKRLNCEMRTNAEKLNWKGILFSTTLKDINMFEILNPFGANVFSYEKGKVYPLRISKCGERTIIDLLLISEGENQHYC